MTPSDRIALARRSQPVAELERKARKAGRRGYREHADLSLAKSHAWSMQHREKVLTGGPAVDRFCFSCWGFEGKHKPRCYYGSVAPTVYVGERNGLAGPVGRLP